jgi:hypothetical protein
MRTLSLCLLLSLFLITPLIGKAQSSLETEQVLPQPADVHVKLLVVDGKKSFRIGDPIRLTLEFTADRPGYYADSIPDQDQPGDLITISPANGVNNWLLERSRGLIFGRDVFSQNDLSATPVRVPLTLNDSLRFDEPGHYTVKVTTRRAAQKDGRVFSS